ncbi:hypothetical protein MKW92_011835 [Papaver armeniacum]|nr:hypothetical protein MKW92_011835 [Papaver armeniacum]
MQISSASTSFRVRVLQLNPTKSRYDDSVISIGTPSVPTLPSNVDFISSPANPFVKHCLKLRQSSSYRHSHSSVIVGNYQFQELVEGKPTTVDCLLVLDGVEVPKGLSYSSMLSGVQSIDSIEAIALMRIPTSFCNLNDNQREADDPGNLGALLRSAIAFGWDGVFMLPGCCDPFNDKALRAARGASFQIPVVYGNWAHLETLKKKNKMKILAAHPESDQGPKSSSPLSRELAKALMDKKLCLIMGSEGNGLSEESKQASELITIPMAGNFESLNVSVAGGIFLFMLQSQNQTLV